MTAQQDCLAFEAQCKPPILTPAVAVIGILMIALCVTFLAEAQTFKLLYQFPGGIVGGWSRAGLTMDRAGNLYGTTQTGGYYDNGYYCELFGSNNPGCGTVFQLVNNNGAWTFNSLFTFHLHDGAYPDTPVTFGPNGNLYGSTSLGGPCGGFGCGTVFSLRPPLTPPPSLHFFWTESAFFAFHDADGSYPSALVFDQAGNIYGTTSTGGLTGAGIVFELVPTGKSFTEKLLYSFNGGADGLYPNGVVFDSAGNLFGTTGEGGNNGCAPFRGCGTVYELTPSGSGWSKTIIHVFDPNTERGLPHGVLIDASGNLYGATSGGVNPGIVWQMTPRNSGWSFNVLHCMSSPGTTMVVRPAAWLWIQPVPFTALLTPSARSTMATSSN
jgi:hypothetical protein